MNVVAPRAGQIVRIALRSTDVALALLCAHLAFGLASDLAGALAWTPPAIETRVLPSPPVAEREASWVERAEILERDLFHEPIAGDPPPAHIVVEEIEPTELALGLLGTIASTDSRIGAAAVWVDDARYRTVVTEGDEIFGSDATVVEIDRGRVLLAEGGEIRELVFDEDSEYQPPKRRTRRRRGRRFRR